MFRSKALRPIAGVVLVTFTALTLQPLTAAAQLPSAPKRTQASSTTGEERFSRTLNEIHEILKEVVPQAAMPHRPRATEPTTAGKPGEKVLQAVGPKMRLESERAKPLPGVDVTAKVKTLRGKYKELKSLESEVTKGFKETEKHIRDKNLPAEILARHEAAVAEYERRKAEFNTLMQAVETAADAQAGSPQAGSLQGALASLGDFMAKYPNEKTHTPTDPNNLPWGSPKPVTRAPYTSPAQFKTSRLFGETVKVAQAGSLSGISLPSTVLPTTPMPADTAPTEDVQITQAIRDLATSLGNNPVKIHNWVRNNIQFVPSYGSIQGSDMTLQTKRGNSFDTASLLIALLRAANIPSRYVYGTIEVPADKAMNWVGGVTAARAAIDIMGQGGIPAMGVTLGGQVNWVRLEHVWVEAFVDYVPSRGAVNRNPNTWVPLDASFKQYQFTQGMDVRTNVPFDAQSFVTQIQQATVVNTADATLQNVNQTLVQQTLASYQMQVRSYVNVQKSNATVSEVLGTQTIVQADLPIFLGTLPYRRIAIGAKMQAIPDNLRWKFRYSLYANDTDRALDSPFTALERLMPSVGTKKITLSFAPATPSDQATIASFMPQRHADGSPVQFTEFSRSLPGYLIRLIPELRIEGQIVATGPAFTMGDEILQEAAIYDPARGWQASAVNRLVVGEYVATVVSQQGIPENLLSTIRSKLSDTAARLTSTSAQAVSKEEFTADLLYCAAIVYFADASFRASAIGRMLGALQFFQPSFGNYLVAARPVFSFGVVRAISFPGLVMDMDRISFQAAAKDGDPRTAIAFQHLIGQSLSENEAAIPEHLFNNVRHNDQGVSATRSMAAALGQGQRIYSIDGANAPLNLPRLTIDAAVKQEISDAVGAGKVAIVSEGNVTIGGWTGVGYVIIDPDTGAGAYKISGGINGGSLASTLANLMALAAGALDALLSLGVGPAFGADAGTTSSNAQTPNEFTLFDCIITIVACLLILVAVAYIVVLTGVVLFVNPIIDIAFFLCMALILYFLSQLISAACANVFAEVGRNDGRNNA
ncbi:MAG TPA: transglutaminase-like domain-containing protein [Burkholderiales bacterium]|nr:transglutaminase-like domain-containing protein [Burkholderiales bacterium]